MAAIRYFADVAGETVMFQRIDHRGRDGKFGYTPATGWVKVERQVTYKSNPSKHECDARCFNATGRSMQCECSCGGKNHGKGSFRCEAA